MFCFPTAHSMLFSQMWRCSHPVVNGWRGFRIKSSVFRSTWVLRRSPTNSSISHLLCVQKWPQRVQKWWEDKLPTLLLQLLSYLLSTKVRKCDFPLILQLIHNFFSQFARVCSQDSSWHQVECAATQGVNDRTTGFLEDAGCGGDVPWPSKAELVEPVQPPASNATHVTSAAAAHPNRPAGRRQSFHPLVRGIHRPLVPFRAYLRRYQSGFQIHCFRRTYCCPVQCGALTFSRLPQRVLEQKQKIRNQLEEFFL